MSDEKLRRRVDAKFSEGDVSGAVRELSGSDGLAPRKEETLRVLQSKHPRGSNVSVSLAPGDSVEPRVHPPFWLYC